MATTAMSETERAAIYKRVYDRMPKDTRKIPTAADIKRLRAEVDRLAEVAKNTWHQHASTQLMAAQGRLTDALTKRANAGLPEIP